MVPNPDHTRPIGGSDVQHDHPRAASAWLDEALGDDDRHGPAGPPSSRAPEEPRVQRPTGPSWPTIVFGVLCLLLAGGVATSQLLDLSVDWSVALPAAVVAVGLLVALLGLASMRGRTAGEEAG